MPAVRSFFALSILAACLAQVCPLCNLPSLGVAWLTVLSRYPLAVMAVWALEATAVASMAAAAAATVAPGEGKVDKAAKGAPMVVATSGTHGKARHRLPKSPLRPARLRCALRHKLARLHPP
jgi:hypothetical protein